MNVFLSKPRGIGKDHSNAEKDNYTERHVKTQSESAVHLASPLNMFGIVAFNIHSRSIIVPLKRHHLMNETEMTFF